MRLFALRLFKEERALAVIRQLTATLYSSRICICTFAPMRREILQEYNRTKHIDLCVENHCLALSHAIINTLYELHVSHM